MRIRNSEHLLTICLTFLEKNVFVANCSPVSKHLLEICDLIDIQRKMELYKSMFYCNIGSDTDTNYIKADSLRIELIAGGLNWKQQEFIMERLQPNIFMEVSTNQTKFHLFTLPSCSVSECFVQKMT